LKKTPNKHRKPSACPNMHAGVTKMLYTNKSFCEKENQFRAYRNYRMSSDSKKK
jgi:hypothetical protein